jgi:hypothetical protein
MRVTPSTWFSARRFALSGVMALAIGAALALWADGASGQSPFTVRVTPSPGAAADVVAVEGVTYAAAKTALNTAA